MTSLDKETSERQLKKQKNKDRNRYNTTDTQIVKDHYTEKGMSRTLPEVRFLTVLAEQQQSLI